MKRYAGTFFSVLAAGFALATALPTAGLAATATATTAPENAQASDCTNADKMMMSAPMTQMTSSGDTDKDFATAMTAHHDAMMTMAKMEVKCGANPAAKLQAQKVIDGSPSFEQQMRAVLYHT